MSIAPLPVPSRLLLTPREAAAALAISERHLVNLTKSGEVPCVRLGRSVRYRPADLQRAIEQPNTESSPG